MFCFCLLVCLFFNFNFYLNSFFTASRHRTDALGRKRRSIHSSGAEMWIPSNATAWAMNYSNGGADEPTSTHILISTEYRRRNATLGAVGVFLNLLVLPLIYTHDDLSIFLKATFCCMATDDLLTMTSVLSAGLIPVDLSEQEYNSILRRLSQSTYLAGNVNCLVMVTIAVERVLALRKPELFKRLTKSKVGQLLCIVASLFYSVS